MDDAAIYRAGKRRSKPDGRGSAGRTARHRYDDAEFEACAELTHRS